MHSKKQKNNFELKLVSSNYDVFGKHCKVYNDGSHFVAVPKIHFDKRTFKRYKNKFNAEEQKFFDELYVSFLMQGVVKIEKLFYLIKTAMLERFPNKLNIDEAIRENIKRQRSNYFSRIKRFKRKANLNIWNKFVTISYDPKKHTEITFRKKLRKCLSNLHSRRGWNYMGVFETAPETNRLHFHAIMYIPENEMVGIIEEKRDWSTAKNKMQLIHINSFFANSFGRNDFEDLTEVDMKSGKALAYLIKYLTKTNEKIIYSRGIPTELNLYIDNVDLICEYFDYVTKYVLLDDCINKFTGYSAWRPPKFLQSNIFDNNFCFA